MSSWEYFSFTWAIFRSEELLRRTEPVLKKTYRMSQPPFPTAPLANWTMQHSEGCGALATIKAVMAVVVEMQNTGHLANRSEIVASIERAFSQEPGDWQILIVGSRGSDDWELKVEGPRGFERIYTLSGSAGERQPEVIRTVLLKLLAGSKTD